MADQRTLCIRADANAQIGIGHVMRCLALAQAWKETGGKVVFLSRPLPPALAQRLQDEGMECQIIQNEAGHLFDARETAGAFRQHKAEWLCVDGYHFPPTFHGRQKLVGAKLLVLDDLADSDLRHPDIILNQNAYATAEMYAACAPQAKLLIGVSHVLLRREFLQWRDTMREAPIQAREVLITMGGSDPANTTLALMRILERLAHSWLNVSLIAGSANPHVESLQQALPTLCGTQHARLLVDPPNLPELMHRADVAITAAGSSCWELAALGVPMLVIETASNQALVARWLKQKQMASVFGPLAESDATHIGDQLDHLIEDATQRTLLASRSRSLIDGEGARRVVAAMQSL